MRAPGERTGEEEISCFFSLFSFFFCSFGFFAFTRTNQLARLGRGPSHRPADDGDDAQRH